MQKSSNKSDKKVRLGMKCGDCMHYVKTPKFEKVCCELGVRDKANAPDCYSPDFYKLNTKDKDKVSKIGYLIKDLKPSQLRILAFTLARTSKLIHEHNLKFGQTVYFSLGGEYLSHYFKGFVTGANDDFIVVSATLNKSKTVTTGQFYRSSLLTKDEFKKKKRELAEKNRLVMSPEEKSKYKNLPIAELIDKHGKVPFNAKKDDFEYEPPTLDSAPQEWFDRSQEKNRKKRKKSKGYIPITRIEDIPKKKSKDFFSFDASKVSK